MRRVRALHITGTHTGRRFNGIEATGSAVALHGIGHFVMRDRKVMSDLVVFDQLQLAQQSGLLPHEGTRSDRTIKRAFNVRPRLLSRVRRR